MKVFGAKAFVFIERKDRKKLDAVTEEGRFVGYSSTSKGYPILMKHGKIRIARDVIFKESRFESLHKFPNNGIHNRETVDSNEASNDNTLNHPKEESVVYYNPDNLNDDTEIDDEDIFLDAQEHLLEEDNLSLNLPEVDILQEEIPAVQNLVLENVPCAIDNSVIQEDIRDIGRESENVQNLPRRSQRLLEKSVQRCNYSCGSVNNNFYEPISWKDLSSLDKDIKQKWIEAAKDEISSLAENQTWTLVTLPEGKKLVSSKWIFKIKLDSEQNVKYKARLVARGFSQTYGIDYEETYAPVAKSRKI